MTINKFILSLLFLLPLGLLTAQENSGDHFTIQVNGLGCPYCAFGLEKKISKLEGIDNFKIEIESGLTEFDIKESNRYSLQDIEDAVQGAGYTPGESSVIRADGSIEESQFAQLNLLADVDESQLTETTFGVSGNCDICKTIIERAAYSIEGVYFAEWTADTETLLLKFDSETVHLMEVHNKIASAGYDTAKVKADKKAYKELAGCCKYR
ncbi:heavy-metal-associated domain-containing protein [Chitinophagales bacterium]|nr:heavy-metal-associated domain-containing protein [Chitinophagales bacterium]